MHGTQPRHRSPSARCGSCRGFRVAVRLELTTTARQDAECRQRPPPGPRSCSASAHPPGGTRVGHTRWSTRPGLRGSRSTMHGALRRVGRPSTVSRISPDASRWAGTNVARNEPSGHRLGLTVERHLTEVGGSSVKSTRAPDTGRPSLFRTRRAAEPCRWSAPVPEPPGSPARTTAGRAQDRGPRDRSGVSAATVACAAPLKSRRHLTEILRPPPRTSPGAGGKSVARARGRQRAVDDRPRAGVIARGTCDLLDDEARRGEGGGRPSTSSAVTRRCQPSPPVRCRRTAALPQKAERHRSSGHALGAPADGIAHAASESPGKKAGPVERGAPRAHTQCCGGMRRNRTACCGGQLECWATRSLPCLGNWSAGEQRAAVPRADALGHGPVAWRTCWRGDSGRG